MYCTHCKKSGHTQEKCYRLHGFPPGFKFTNSSNSRINSVSTESPNNPSSEFTEAVTGLTDAQCKQFIAMFSGKLASSNVVTTEEFTGGTHYILSSTTGNYKSNIWIIDSGTTRHICNDQSLFFKTQEVFHTRVKLPNQMLIQVHLMGNLKLNEDLVLHDVLFVPQFELNIISVTCLTKGKNVMVALYHDSG